jgi:holo-[acyl-carrier protein] synthase
MIVGIGTDVIDIARVKRMFATHGDRMLQRLFTAEEIRYTENRADRPAALAVRLAAKEATYKALTGNDLARAISWRDIEVCNNGDGAPTLTLHGRAAARVTELGVTRILVTLSHSDASAVAFVVAERE